MSTWKQIQQLLKLNRNESHGYLKFAIVDGFQYFLSVFISYETLRNIINSDNKDLLHELFESDLFLTTMQSFNTEQLLDHIDILLKSFIQTIVQVA
jgi:hypothetical protein